MKIFRCIIFEQVLQLHSPAMTQITFEKVYPFQFISKFKEYLL